MIFFVCFRFRIYNAERVVVSSSFKKSLKQQTRVDIKVSRQLLTLNTRKFDPHHNFVLAPQVSAIFNALDSPSL